MALSCHRQVLSVCYIHHMPVLLQQTHTYRRLRVSQSTLCFLCNCCCCCCCYSLIYWPCAMCTASVFVCMVVACFIGYICASQSPHPLRSLNHTYILLRHQSILLSIFPSIYSSACVCAMYMCIHVRIKIVLQCIQANENHVLFFREKKKRSL